MTSPAASDVESFRQQLARTAGLRLERDRLPYLAELLSARIAATRSRGAADYLRGPSTTQREVVAIAQEVSVSETYFLRNPAHFDALAHVVLQARGTPRPAQRRELRFLSAGCSTGEEAYSIAIHLNAVLPEPHTWDVSVTGVDFNDRSLAHARRGRYGQWALRATPEHVRDEYFVRRGGEHEVIDTIKSRVRFEWHNLADARDPFWRLARYDGVFCRNVLMYLTPETVRGIVARFATALVPGGCLFLGHADHLRGLSDQFLLQRSHGTFYYVLRASPERARASHPPSWGGGRAAPSTLDTPRLRDGSSTSADGGSAVPGETWAQEIACASLRVQRLSEASELRDAAPREPPVRATDEEDRLEAIRDLIHRERFHTALRLLAQWPPGAEPSKQLLLLRAVLQLTQGRIADARHACNQLLALDELNAGAHYTLALCCEQEGDEAGAADHCRAATYVDDRFAMPHLHLGRLARRSGDTSTAARELSVAASLLPNEDVARIQLFGGGFGRDALLAACRSELSACKKRDW